jgi:hypothetical protein
VEVLEGRARALAAEGRGVAEASDAVQAVTFHLGRVACAIEAALVARAVLRLGGLVAVPLGDGAERAVAFVDERPVPVLDLAGFAARAPRPAEALAGRPALVIAARAGEVALAVDGPLDLANEALVPCAGGDAGERVPVAGRLAGGAALLASAWVSEWARQGASR